MQKVDKCGCCGSFQAEEKKMLRKIMVESGAEKFALFKTSDGSFFLRALCLPYHNDIMDKFESGVWRHSLNIVSMGGAKFCVNGDTVTLYGCSASWGNFPNELKGQLMTLFRKAFPGKKIIDKLE